MGIFCQFQGPLDENMSMPALVQHTFHKYEGIAGAIGTLNGDAGDGYDAKDKAMLPDEECQTSPVNSHSEADVIPNSPNLDMRGEEEARGDGHNQGDPAEEDREYDDLWAMDDGNLTDRQVLEECACTPLFAGARLTQLSRILLLLNCLRTHGASNALVSKLFQLLSATILPTINSLPTLEYVASKILRQLGLAYKTIHVCPGPNTCMFFRGPVALTLEKCSKCGANRFRKVGKAKIPVKVLRHFLLIPRLERMYSTSVQASFMTSHAWLQSTDRSMRGAYDLHQWKFVNWRWWEEFAKEDRILRLGMATDGVNPFSIKRSNHSTWPVLIMNYNLPPWMTTKKHFIMLSLIIPEKKSVIGDNFNTYLEPLVEELRVL